jgi:hypothetical protein
LHPATTFVASDQQPKGEAGLNARRTTARSPTRPPSLPAVTASDPLVVRSFASPITIHDGALITIQRVRQQVACLIAGPRAESVIVGAAPPDSWSRTSTTLERAISASKA